MKYYAHNTQTLLSNYTELKRKIKKIANDQNVQLSNTTMAKKMQLFEQDIGPLKRSLSAKTRRFSRISEIALVTNCFCANTCLKKRVNVSYNCQLFCCIVFCVCFVIIFFYRKISSLFSCPVLSAFVNGLRIYCVYALLVYSSLSIASME